MLTCIGNNLEFFAEIRVQLAYANSVSIKLSEYASDFRRKILPQNVTIVNRFLKIYIFVKQKTLPVRHTGGFCLFDIRGVHPIHESDKMAVVPEISFTLILYRTSNVMSIHFLNFLAENFA